MLTHSLTHLLPGAQFNNRTIRLHDDHLIYGWDRRRSAYEYFIPDPVATVTTKSADGTSDVVTKYAYIKLRPGTPSYALPNSLTHSLTHSLVNAVQAIEIYKDSKLYLKEFHDCIDALQASKDWKINSMVQDYLYVYCTDNIPEDLTQKVPLCLLTCLLTHSFTDSQGEH